MKTRDIGLASEERRVYSDPGAQRSTEAGSPNPVLYGASLSQENRQQMPERLCNDSVFQSLVESDKGLGGKYS